MGTIKHTREPWEAVYDETRPYGTIFADERSIRVATVNSTPGQLNVEHNTRRIVECVNACSGIADPSDSIRALREVALYIQESEHAPDPGVANLADTIIRHLGRG